MHDSTRSRAARGGRRRALTWGLSLLAVGGLSVAAGGITAGGAAAPPRFTATPIAQVESAEGVKSGTARLAESDPSLLGRLDATPVNVMVKYDYDATASYAGGVAGLEATSPKKTGKGLRENRRAVEAYEQYLERRERQINADVAATVDGARVRDSFRTAYGGVAMTLPANEVADLLAVDGVVAVQRDALSNVQTDASPAFIGATTAWGGLGGSTKAGEGVIVGVLDTGIWPEHPSYDDNGIDHPGGTYACEFGNGLDPALGAPYSCDDKLIGAYAFLDTYMALIGALPGEYCNNVTDVCSARDSDGHGTHTSSTAAGSAVSNATLLGVNRGNISGIAPGAHVIMYRVCLAQGCFQSDSVAAVQQAILDGVDVLNFSISGGASAYTDPVELAFLDAYEAGIIVNASAGNSGPAAGTANHAGPWTNTVGASTSNRHFLASLSLNGGAFTATGVTVTAGIAAPTPVVRASSVPAYDERCLVPAAPGSFTGKIVACARGINARVDKGYNVLQGGAAGMILYNVAIQGLNSDNHWLPTIHLEGPPSGPAPLVTFLTANPGATATFTGGTAAPVTGDVMAPFSSRGPLGDFIKPDVTSVGVQVLAGHTPTPISITGGPPGQLYQAIAGTSMSSPHAAGVAALVKAAHPKWTPGQIKSAMMTQSVQSVLKETGAPSDPFDRGAGSVRADRAIAAPITFDVDAADYIASAGSPLGRIDLNLPSINAPTMSGEIQTKRTLRNVTNRFIPYVVTTAAPAGAKITVDPDRFSVARNSTRNLRITISAPSLPNGQYFGQITLTPQSGGDPSVLPVAFNKRQGAVNLTHSCSPTAFLAPGPTSCAVQAQNNSASPANASVRVSGHPNLNYSNVTGPAGTLANGNGFTWSGNLTPALAPAITAFNLTPGGSPAGGYLPLSLFGIPPIAGAGDETIHTFNTPTFRYGHELYSRISMVSNGYAVVGGGTAADIVFDPPASSPSTARPNNVLGGYWTDLDPSAGGAMRIASLTDGVNTWLVLEWDQVAVFGQPAQRQSFQQWIRLSATVEDITYAYGPVTGTDSGDGLMVGAENRDGTSAKTLAGPPSTGQEYTVVTAPPTPGGTASFTYDVGSSKAGVFDTVAALTSDITPGTTLVPVSLTITK